MNTPIIKLAIILLLQVASGLLLAQQESKDFSKHLQGRFIMEQANCAGFEFTNTSRLIWYNEITCQYPDTLALYWINSTTFITKEIKRINETSPPRNWLYKVNAFDGTTLHLTVIWTGWGAYTEREQLLTLKNK